MNYPVIFQCLINKFFWVRDKVGVSIPHCNALIKGFWEIYGSWGGRTPPEKVILPPLRTGLGFLAPLGPCQDRF